MIDNLLPGTKAHFWHVGVRTLDFDASQEELSGVLGATWTAHQDRSVNSGPMHRVAYTEEYPNIELIEEVENKPGLPRLDHLAYFTESFEDDCSRLIDRGVPQEMGGVTIWGGKWAYFNLAATGIRLELCEYSARDKMIASWCFRDLR